MLCIDWWQQHKSINQQADRCRDITHMHISRRAIKQKQTAQPSTYCYYQAPKHSLNWATATVHNVHVSTNRKQLLKHGDVKQGTTKERGAVAWNTIPKQSRETCMWSFQCMFEASKVFLAWSRYDPSNVCTNTIFPAQSHPEATVLDCWQANKGTKCYTTNYYGSSSSSSSEWLK